MAATKGSCPSSPRGVLGAPLIGHWQEQAAEGAIEQRLPGVYSQVSTENEYFLGRYSAIDEARLDEVPADTATQVIEIARDAKQGALARVTIFPGLMLATYLSLILWFRARGGYRPVTLQTTSSA